MGDGVAEEPLQFQQQWPVRLIGEERLSFCNKITYGKWFSDQGRRFESCPLLIRSPVNRVVERKFYRNNSSVTMQPQQELRQVAGGPKPAEEESPVNRDPRQFRLMNRGKGGSPFGLWAHVAPQVPSRDLAPRAVMLWQIPRIRPSFVDPPLNGSVQCSSRLETDLP